MEGAGTLARALEEGHHLPSGGLFRRLWIFLSGDGSLMRFKDRRRLARSLLLYSLGDVPSDRGLWVDYGAGSPKRARSPVGRAASGVMRALEDGATLSEAMSAQKRSFLPWEVDLVRAGERAGEVRPILEAWEGILKRLRAAGHKMRATAFYPAVLIVIGVFILTLVRMKVWPTFDALYSATDVPIPMAADVLLRALRWVGLALGFLLKLAPWIFVLVALGRRVPVVRYALDRLVLWLPLAGGAGVYRGRVVLLQVLAALRASGLPAHEAFSLAAAAQPNRVLRGELGRAAARLADGVSLKELRTGRLLDRRTLRSLRWALRSEDEPAALRTLAGQETRGFDIRWPRIVNLLEIGMVLFVSLVLALGIVALYAAMFGTPMIVKS